MSSEERLKLWSQLGIEAQYTKGVPRFIKSRLDWELKHCITNADAFVNATLVTKLAEENGALVFCKDGIAASMTAYALGLTGINPAEPHYYCNECGYTEIVEGVECAVEMPNQLCPICGASMDSDGYDIFAESFLGIDGSKTPVIDLDVSSEKDNEKLTLLANLQKQSNIKVLDIPLNDKATLEYISKGNLSTGIDGFEDIVSVTGLSSFVDLIKVVGLSLSSNAWENNTEELVRAGQLTLSDLIATRDELTRYLIQHNFTKEEALRLSERVRMGRGLTEENIKLMQEYNIPRWCIDFCKKVRYLAPKARAVSVALLLYRIGYYEK